MLFRKMLRDMGQHKTQFISIFIMAFLGVYIYAGIGGEWMGLTQASGSYYRQTNLADIWLYGKDFTSSDENAVKELDGVTNAQRSLVVDGIGKLSGNPKVSLHFVEKNEISKAYIVSGEEFSADKKGIWIDARFAKARGLVAGGKISVTCNGITLNETIRGTIYSPEYVYNSSNENLIPDYSSYGYAYLSYKEFPAAIPIAYNVMTLKTTKNRDIAKLESRVDSALNGKDSVFIQKKSHPSYAMFQQEIDQHKAMGDIFPVAFLLIALLTMLTTMTRIVTNQRVQIGTLKALGFKKGRIMRHYISYGFGVSLAGSLLGAIAGPMTLPYLFYPSLSGFYTLPKWAPAFDASFYIMAAATVLLCTLVTYLACRSVLKDTPAKTLLPKAPRSVRHSLMEKTAFWKKLGFNAQWNLRDIIRSKVRSIMAVIGVLGCTALLVCAFGMNDAMNDMKDWQYSQLNRFESKLSVSDTATPAQIESAIKAVNGQAVMEGSVEIKANGLKKTGDLTVTDHVTLLRYTDANRNLIDLPQNGVSLSYKMANMLSVKRGDKITWHIYGNEKWVTTTVDGIYRNPTSQGITLTKGCLEKLGYTFKATAILSSAKISSKPAGVSSIFNTGSLLKGWNELTKSMMMMVYILIAAAALLAVVVLYNLGILSFTEMERELATLKVVGLKSRKLRRLMLTQNLLLSAVGFILGVPVGKALVDAMISMTGDSFDMVCTLHPANIVLSLAITFLLSYLVNLMFAPRLKRIDMVGALKGVE